MMLYLKVNNKSLDFIESELNFDQIFVHKYSREAHTVDADKVDVCLFLDGNKLIISECKQLLRQDSTSEKLLSTKIIYSTPIDLTTYSTE